MEEPPIHPSDPPVPPRVALRVSGLVKSYASLVLAGVDIDLRAGELHALVGENGAGKSTLARIIAGLTPADRGGMQLDGEPYAPSGKRDAEHRGVRLVMQELNLISNLTVAENIFLDRLPHRLGWIDYPELHRQARKVMDDVGLAGIQPDRAVKTLGVGQQQLVEIAAGLSGRCSVLILDEPTAALTDPEIERLFGQIRQLKARGVGILYISHRLEEIKQIADRITVLRDGQMIATRSAAEVSIDEVVRLMVGRDIGEAVHRPRSAPGEVVLRVEQLTRRPAVEEVSFAVCRGEILGFAGLMGSGRTETLRAVFGADRPDAGQVFIGGSNTAARIRSPRDAVRHGVALLTEDRKTQGLLLPLPIRVNMTLARLGSIAGLGGWISHRQEHDAARSWVKSLAVRCSSPEQPVAELSGGNQQKVVIAKWLFRDCDILLFDEPTRGIDVGAKFEIYQLLGDLAARGKAIVMVSSDLKELMAVCDRIAVMSAGRIAGMFTRGEWTEDKIMTAAFSGYLERAET